MKTARKEIEGTYRHERAVRVLRDSRRGQPIEDILRSSATRGAKFSVRLAEIAEVANANEALGHARRSISAWTSDSSSALSLPARALIARGGVRFGTNAQPAGASPNDARGGPG